MEFPVPKMGMSSKDPETKNSTQASSESAAQDVQHASCGSGISSWTTVPLDPLFEGLETFPEGEYLNSPSIHDRGVGFYASSLGTSDASQNHDTSMGGLSENGFWLIPENASRNKYVPTASSHNFS